MKLAQIEAKLAYYKNEALLALGVPAEVADPIALADAPDPAMGDRGFPVFALARVLRRAPAQIAAEAAERLAQLSADDPMIASVQAAGPYVNFTLDAGELARTTIAEIVADGDRFGAGFVERAHRIAIEFSSPNTNKPQHLGHVRNNLLGASVARILEHAGHDVVRVNLINDRGIHICKSMLAYAEFGRGETPASSGTKGDHLVGHYYVVFNEKFREEYAAWLESDEARAARERWASERPDGAPTDEAAFRSAYEDLYFNRESELGARAQEMLVAWERGDAEVRALWAQMNAWVFGGFDETYRRIGVGFDRVDKESENYALGKELVDEGLQSGIFRRLDDGAVACDLAQIGMEGDKILLRSNGTSVYMTQDLGTAYKRVDETEADRLLYVTGDEQEHHFRVLFGILGLLRPELVGTLEHLSYGMVELPRGMGKMKSREGTAVDADDLMDRMHALAREAVDEREPGLEESDAAARAEAIGLGALKYMILDYNPRTTVHFDPREAVKFEGRTGARALYTYARIQSIGREIGGWPELSGASLTRATRSLGTEHERAVLTELRAWPRTLATAARDYDPSKVSEFIFKVCKAYNALYNDADHVIKDLEGPRREGLALLSRATAVALGATMRLLLIEPIEAM